MVCSQAFGLYKVVMRNAKPKYPQDNEAENQHTHTLQPEVTFAVTWGGLELSAPQGGVLTTGGAKSPASSPSSPSLLGEIRELRVEGEDRGLLFSHSRR